jgi:hypothetical protein
MEFLFTRHSGVRERQRAVLPVTAEKEPRVAGPGSQFPRDRPPSPVTEEFTVGCPLCHCLDYESCWLRIRIVPDHSGAAAWVAPHLKHAPPPCNG